MFADYGLQAHRLASSAFAKATADKRVSRERALTQPRRSHTDKHRGTRSSPRRPRGRVAAGPRGARRTAEGRAGTSHRTIDSGSYPHVPHTVQRAGRTAGPRGHTGGGRFLSCRGCDVRAHAQLDEPSPRKGSVDPCSPCNPWLAIASCVAAARLTFGGDGGAAASPSRSSPGGLMNDTRRIGIK